jgi:CAP12/Pycsar effector protein, TIR domain
VTSTKRPSLFIGSSTEGLRIAKAIQANLDASCETTLWSQGVFGLGEGTLESLVGAIEVFDFAVLVLTPDDLLETRTRRTGSPRDNVLLELGLFIGGLGRQRTFTVYDRTANLKLPSDLAGVTAATFQPHATMNWLAAVGPACTHIESAIQKLGLRPRLDATQGICTVEIYYHKRGFTKATAEDFAARIAHPAVRARLHEHDIASTPNALFIGALIRAEEARTLLWPLPHDVRCLFPPDYPESEGGDLTGRSIGVGYSGEYNDSRRGERSVPVRVSQAQLRRLFASDCSNAEFQQLLHGLTVGRKTWSRRLA